MKYFFSFILFFSLLSCKSSLVNYALEKKGIYDDKITINKFNRDNSEVCFFEMAHVGTDLFYKDLKLKIDSLEKSGFYFYYELIKKSNSSDSINRKFIKLTKIPFQKDGYMGSLDSIFKKEKIKLKKNLISQPEYSLLGLSNENSANVDLSLAEIINYYEKKYQLIILEPCDFEVSVYESPKCPLDLTKDIRDDVILNSRNEEVLRQISIEKRKKIAIIFGKGHYEGIKEGLLKIGYNEVIE
ncbi:hypothetical protein [uncultured Flavobacterium sp.]|uniref:hypothetical protein n=1 Tax=uncultured Flavobacterium sp. TaxID=165435 RepID=UPI0030C8272F